MFMKFIKFIKKHSSTVVGITVFVLVIIAILLIKNTLSFDESEAIYGSRLEGINKVKISNNQKSNVESKITDGAKKVKVRISGKVVNTIITTDEGVAVEDAKNMAVTILEEFTDEQKKFYDFQFLIKNKKNTEQYPIIGYKQRTRDKITWTKDR